MDSKTLIANRSNFTRGRQRYLGAIQYKGEQIAQYHNPKNLIQDIIGENETKQFTSILLIGSPGTGKTTLATFIAHNIHTQQDYIVIHFGKQELLRFDSVMDSLPNRNLILIFDDVSLVFKNIKDPTKRTKILTTLTEARHPKFEGSNRRVIVIANIHYTNAIEKMWRSQGGWKIYTDLSNEEIQIFNNMTKSYFKHKAQLYANVTMEMFRRKKFTVSLTNNKTRTYVIDKPFRFVMCYDNSNLRFFLVPQEFCNFCSVDQNKLSRTKATPKEVIELAKKYYKTDGIAGLKLALLLAGHTEQYRNNLIYAFRTATDLLSSFDINREELAKELRKLARIKDTRLCMPKKKKTNFFKDLEELRQSENVIEDHGQEIRT